MPPEGHFRQTTAPTRAYRFVRLVIHILYGCATEALVFPFVSRARQTRIIKWWSRGILEILHVRVHIEGHVPSAHPPTIIVANHVSWLDIWILQAVCPLRLVAKSDIRRWPVIGWLAARAGTIFIERGKRHDTARINRTIMQTLDGGERVGIFPEGTTTDGTEIKPFHASLFQPALGAGARLVTAAIRYPRGDGSPNLDASYADDRALLESVGLILRYPTLHADLMFGASIEVSGKTRRDLAHECEEAISAALGLPAPDKKSGKSFDPRSAALSDDGPKGSPYPARKGSAKRTDPARTSDRK
jgi:1-acyl-sn-glycerol-3-phosphate acyltransferase